VTARLLSSIHRTTSGERLFVCGLLHDIGHLIMYQSIPEECQEAILKSKRKGVPLYKIERDLFGFDYAKLGGGMMRQWGLPVSLWEPVQYHVEPQMAEEYPEETSLTHLSALFTGAIEDKENFNEGIWQADPATWDATKLTAEQCQTIQGDAEKQVNEIMNAFFG